MRIYFDNSATTRPYPEVAAAVDRVLAACRKHGITPGIVTGTQEAAVSRVRQGFQLVTCMNDQVFFRTESFKRLQAIRQSLSET